MNPASPPALRPAPSRSAHSIPGETQAVAVTSAANPASSPPSRRWGRLFRWTLVLGLAGAGWYFFPQWWPWVQSHLHAKPTATKSSGPRTIPVVTATVAQRNLDLYLNGLGTVTPFNRVTVRSRVGGELVNVAFAEGQMVKAGDLLAEIDPRPYQMQLEQSQGQLARDEAALNLARLNLSRQQDLIRSQATTPQLVDQQLATVQQAEAVIQTDKALVDNAQLQLSYCRITAPISGRIGLHLVDRGNIVQANELAGIALITQLHPISLVFTIPQDDIPRVLARMKQQKDLVVEAYDRDFQTRLATGTLSAIDNQVDSATGTLKLKAVFPNDDNSLFPNQFVNARLLVDTLPQAVTVAAAAIQRGPDDDYVYVVKPDETVELRTIVVGPSEGNDVAILSGLKPGEIVVTDGVDKLQPGTKVSFRSGGKGPSGKPEAKTVEKASDRPAT